jgi:acyl-CoA reductase-like NAD-dependent aldehyde dehydrogenase
MTRYQMLIGGELVDAEGDRRLEAVNPYTRGVFATVPNASGAAQAPFGGVRRSGYGRERGREALQEYLRTKNVMIDLSGSTPDPFAPFE